MVNSERRKIKLPVTCTLSQHFTYLMMRSFKGSWTRCCSSCSRRGQDFSLRIVALFIIVSVVRHFEVKVMVLEKTRCGSCWEVEATKDLIKTPREKSVCLWRREASEGNQRRKRRQRSEGKKSNERYEDCENEAEWRLRGKRFELYFTSQRMKIRMRNKLQRQMQPKAMDGAVAGFDSFSIFSSVFFSLSP